MDRRRFLQAAGSFSLLGARARAADGRTRPSDAAWPSKKSWDRLRDAVDGNLAPLESPFAAGASWQDLLPELRNPYYLGEHPALTENLGWVGAWTSKPSAYAVAAKSAGHIAAAVDFAREHNLRLVVKGGGHSYQGTSNAPDSLLVWTRHLNDIAMHSAFVPQGCDGAVQSQPAVTLGSGNIWMHAYEAVTTQAGRYVQGGGCTTVGVAGLIQSGGFGSFSKRYGLAAAGLLEAEVVTADGKVRIANARTNPDLFWALKGGGGGTFGAMSKLTLRVRELPESFGGAIFSVKAASDEAYRSLLRRFLAFYKDHLCNQHWGEQARVHGGNTLGIQMVFAGLDSQEANRAWKPFLDWVGASRGLYQLQGPPVIAALPARNWWNPEFMNRVHPGAFAADPRPGAPAGNAWWTGDGGQAAQVLYGFESLWLPAALLEGDAQDRLANALFEGSRHWDIELHFNKGLAGAPPDAVRDAADTATNPSVLTAFALAIVAGGQGPAYPGIRGHEPDQAAAAKAVRGIARSMGELRRLASDGGSYVSESNFFERDWQHSYWGGNYPRLAAVKKKYDPAGLFFVHNGVGSEAWSGDGFTRR